MAEHESAIPKKKELAEKVRRITRSFNIWKRIRLWSGYLYVVAVMLVANRFYVAAGLVLVALGILLRGWAAGYLTKNRELSRLGPYKFVRHPLYCGSFLLGLGVTVAFTNWLFLLGYLVYFSLLYRLSVNAEEQRLHYQFDENFSSYKQQVNGFCWPTLALSRDDFCQWRLELFLRNKEHRHVITFMVVLALLVVRVHW
ncbi:MAG: isoprenylcysteine carboxylmethyltransferase family protein [Pseudomonadota bacterium]